MLKIHSVDYHNQFKLNQVSLMNQHKQYQIKPYKYPTQFVFKKRSFKEVMQYTTPIDFGIKKLKTFNSDTYLINTSEPFKLTEADMINQYNSKCNRDLMRMMFK